MGTRCYIIRLDDACEKRDIEKWDRIEGLLDKYSIKPLVGVIPKCEDPMMDIYSEDYDFWNRVHSWQNKGWSIAMHGFRHVYDSDDGGMIPVNHFSEFAGHPIEIQRERIRSGIKILRGHGIEPRFFFAPGHTFDENTLRALKQESEIRIISDTIAWDIYTKDGFIFIPQQSGRIRRLPFKTTTFCYHPNTMTDKDFDTLSEKLSKIYHEISSVEQVIRVNRDRTMVDEIITKMYLVRHIIIS